MTGTCTSVDMLVVNMYTINHDNYTKKSHGRLY